MGIRRANGNNKPGEPRKYQHISNSPFSFEDNGIKVECTKDNMIVITQDNKDEDGTPVTDVITCKPSLVNKISKMLYATAKVEWKDYPFRKE